MLSSERRPLGTGTTAEAVGTLAFAAAHQRHEHGSVEEDPPPPVAAPAARPPSPSRRAVGVAGEHRLVSRRLGDHLRASAPSAC